MLDLVNEPAETAAVSPARADGATTAVPGRRSGLMTVSGPFPGRTFTPSPGKTGDATEDPDWKTGSLIAYDSMVMTRAARFGFPKSATFLTLQQMLQIRFRENETGLGDPKDYLSVTTANADFDKMGKWNSISIISLGSLRATVLQWLPNIDRACLSSNLNSRRCPATLRYDDESRCREWRLVRRECYTSRRQHALHVISDERTSGDGLRDHE